MPKIIKLTESDLARIVKRVISEQSNAVNIPMVWELSKKLGLKYSKPMGPDQVFFHYGDKASLAKQQIWMDITNNKPMTITVQDERGVKEFPASTPIDKIVNYAKGSTNYKKLTDSEPKDSIKEQLNDRAGDLYADINSLIDFKYNDVDYEDVANVLENILRGVKAQSYRNKKGIKPISSAEVLKNFGLKKNFGLNEQQDEKETMLKRLMRKLKGVSDKQLEYNIENDLPWDWKGSKEGFYEKMEPRKKYSGSN